MKRSNFNQTQAAEHLGFDLPYMSQLINRKRSPGLANAVTIEEKTGIPVEAWLIDVDESDESQPALAGKRRVARG